MTGVVGTIKSATPTGRQGHKSGSAPERPPHRQPRPRTSRLRGGPSRGLNGLHKGIPAQASTPEVPDQVLHCTFQDMADLKALRLLASTRAASCSDSASGKASPIMTRSLRLQLVQRLRRRHCRTGAPATIPATRPKIETVPSDMPKTIYRKSTKRFFHPVEKRARRFPVHAWNNLIPVKCMSQQSAGGKYEDQDEGQTTISFSVSHRGG
jgi:hypothetical protein